MSKLTKFKVRRSQFPLDFRIDNTTRDTNIKTLTAMPGTVFEEGTEETAEIYNGLQLGLVHSVTPVKSVTNSIDYYTCDIDGLADFGMHNELKLQIKITATNEYDQPKIKMAGNDYQIMRFDGVQLTQVLTGQLKTDNIYNLSFNGTLFILSSGMIAEKEVKALLDTNDFQATETIKGISQLATQPEVDAGVEDTKIVTSKKLKAILDSMLASIGTNFVKLTQLATETTNGISKIATQTTVDAGVEDTKIVTSKKLKARLDSLLASIGTNFVKLTQLATESIAGIVKISTTAQVTAGTDNTTAVSPAKLKEIFVNGSTKTQNGYQKLPSGVIMQWGMVSDGIANVTFPVAFPTGCASLQITRGGGTNANSVGSLDVGASVIISMSNTGFMFDSVVQAVDKSLVYYVAIGY